MSIPNNLRAPTVAVEIDNTRAQQGPALLAYSVLLVGQKTAGGTATADTVYRVTSAEDVSALAGRGSQLHRQARAYFATNRVTETFVGVLADAGAGAAATGTIALSGTATESGTLHLYLGGQYVPVGVSSGDAAAAVATAIAAAVPSTSDLPVTSSVSTATVTLTARNKGLCGNDLDIRLNYQDGQKTPAGLTATITAMSGGTTNPSLTNLLAALGDRWFHLIAHPYTDATSLTALEGFLSERFGPTKMLDAVAITSAPGTLSALSTLGESRNSPHSVIIAQPGKSPLMPPAEFAAAVAGVVAISGSADPALPLQTLAVPGVLPPAEQDRFTFEERNLELFDGIGTTKVAAGGVVVLERPVTTYRVNAAGADDTSYLDVTTMLTVMYLRFSFRTRLARFSRYKLANDGVRVGPGQKVITPKLGKAEALNWFREMELLGLVEDFEQFKRDLVVQRNPSDPGRMDWILPPNLVNGFNVGAVSVQFIL
jgi:phage tail sheath gpL-like